MSIEFKATTKYVMLSPKKIWKVTRELRGLTYKKAMENLRESSPKACRVLEKLLKSCFYNALQKDSHLSEEDLVIDTIHVGQGPVLKRMSPRAQGRADVISKPTAHINVVLKKKEN